VSTFSPADRAGRDGDVGQAGLLDRGAGRLGGHVGRADDLLLGELVLDDAAADEADDDDGDAEDDQDRGCDIATDREELGHGTSSGRLRARVRLEIEWRT